MPTSLTQRLLSPIVDVRRDEARTLLLMFAYSFLVMTAYNIVKPMTRAEFIAELGADNLPWVLLVSGVLVGVVVQLYTRGIARLPPRSVLPATHLGVAALLVVFWALFSTDVPGTSVLFYFVGQILGLLLISQFWTLANDIYDARQAKRLFGFIGGGASFGGMVGSGLLTFLANRVGSTVFLLLSAALLVACATVVTSVIRGARDLNLSDVAAAGRETGVSGRDAFQLLRESRHLQLISLIVGFAAIGAGLLDQQLNMATEEAFGGDGADSITAFLSQVQLYVSIAGFVIQVWLTSKIHRYLGIGFALMMLPVALGSIGGLILVTGALWAAAVGRTLDASLRYTVDKTSREILFLPLPAHLKQQAKPLVDVTVDRFAKGLGAAITLVLIQPWGLGLTWPQLSWVSLTVTAVWIAGAIQARRQYLSSFRQSIIEQGVHPTEVRLPVADLSTVETVVEELAHPDEDRVLYAIDVLESLDKRNLVTPLLLHHESAAVRVRALGTLGATRSDIAARWAPTIEGMVKDADADVRAAAIGALAGIRGQEATAIARTLMTDDDPRITVTAAVVLSGSDDIEDRRVAEETLNRLAVDTQVRSAAVRRDLASFIRRVESPQVHDLLVPLLHDADPDVADEAMRSVQHLGTADFLFAPTLVSLLGNRRLKSGARASLVRYGEPVVDLLEYFLEDADEDIWVRRHIPATLARIPGQKSMDVLMASLTTDDAFLRFKSLTAIEKLRRDRPELTFDPEGIEQLALAEGRAYFNRLGLHYNLFVRAGRPQDSVLARALEEKVTRSVDRIYRLLGVLLPWTDVAAARWAIEHGQSRPRASALEYLDNVLPSVLRHRLIPVLEDAPVADKVRRGNVLLKTRPRDVEETLLELINDDDEVIAAAAIDVAGRHALAELQADIEHVLAHRDPTHYHVLDAAAWTLAHRASPDEPARHPSEHLPSVVLVARMRALELFASVGVDELFRIAGAGHQTRHERSTTILQEGASPQQLHILLDGDVTATSKRAGVRTVTAPAALGVEEALDGRVMAETIKTVDQTVTLALTNDELLTLLADNTDLVQGLFRTIAARERDRMGYVKGTGAAVELARLARGTLTPIDKGLALRHVPIFSKLSGPEMVYLSSIAQPLRLHGGTRLTDASIRPGLGIVLTGQLRLEATKATHTAWDAGPGDVIGMYEMLAGLEPRLDRLELTATEPAVILQVEQGDFFDLLSQRPGLLQQIFTAIFDQTTRAPVASAAPPA